MMGSGKSYWCKKLSEKLGCGGYDLDALIESQEEKTISEIFAENGELYFRKTEAEILRRLAVEKTFILATGGGTPCFQENMQWMNKNGVTIWIDEPVQVLAERLQKEKSHRPLIQQLSNGALHQFLEQKLAERKSFYSLATYHLQDQQVTDKSFEQIIQKIIQT